MADPVATWDGPPVVTFPFGCEDPALIHVEFVIPTFDRDPDHIPVFLGSLGTVDGICANPPIVGLVQSGDLPSPTTDYRWFGEGPIRYDLYIDGSLWRTLLPGPGSTPGATMNLDVPTGTGAPIVDWTVSHSFTVKTTFEDIPAWRFWIFDLGVVCPPILPSTEGSPYWPWAQERAHLWPAGFDPGGGIDWGPFGTDIPDAVLGTGATYLQTITVVEDTVDAVTYDFTSPAGSYSCAEHGFFDPAAGATPDLNPAPGTGGNPTYAGGVTVTTDWGCRDGRSFKITASSPATSPYNSGGPAAEPAYLELTPAGGNFDEWYYQSMLLYMPPGFAASLDNLGGDTWKIMGIRHQPSAGTPAWSDLTVGLALQESGGFFTVRSFVGPADVYSGLATAYFGTPVSVSEGTPHCLRLAVKREADDSGTRDFLFWEYQVDNADSGPLQTRAAYNKPNYAVWGLLDNAAHEGNFGGHPSVFYVDELRWDTSPVGCRCKSLGSLAIYPKPVKIEVAL